MTVSLILAGHIEPVAFSSAVRSAEQNKMHGRSAWRASRRCLAGHSCKRLCLAARHPWPSRGRHRRRASLASSASPRCSCPMTWSCSAACALPGVKARRVGRTGVTADLLGDHRTFRVRPDPCRRGKGDLLLNQPQFNVCVAACIPARLMSRHSSYTWSTPSVNVHWNPICRAQWVVFMIVDGSADQV
jgi:hypothetical protein